ncbi:hypothetical protein [Arsukibacterium sp.]|uniref:hypothetical protein n=1 Tax=Arsukibacterium sp. TaxID=1977258 RepID=UPI002FDB79D0
MSYLLFFRLFTLLVVIGISGCSVNNPPYTSMSLMRFESPELSEKPLTTQLHFSVSEERQFTLSNNAEPEVTYGCSYRPASATRPATYNQCKQEYNVYRGAVAVAPGLEFTYTKHATHRVSVKHQFAGQYREAAGSGNWSQAVVAGYNWQQADFADELRFELISPTGGSSNGVQTNSWQQKTTGYDIGYVLGYRASPSLLIYGGPYLYKGALKGEQILTIAVDNGQTQRIFDLKSSGQQLGANLALQFNLGQHFILQTELVSSQLRWQDAKKTASQFNVMVGVQF